MYRHELSSLIQGCGKELNGIEVGVASGNYSVILNAWGFKNLYLVDAWEEFRDQTGKLTTQATCDKWYKDLQKRVPNANIYKAKSLDAVKVFADNYFDFIYIDADHSYKSVKDDLNAWWPKCKKGGLMAGHDYLLKGTGVKQAVDEFCKSKNIKISLTKGSFRIPASWYFIKGEI